MEDTYAMLKSEKAKFKRKEEKYAKLVNFS